MRLIDADKLFVNMDKGMQGSARDYLKFYQMAVRDEPTAYDVDKVCKEISENKEMGMDNWIDADHAISIVKTGGIEQEEKENGLLKKR